MLFPLANLFGPENWFIIAIVGLLLFGRRLPEVGRSLGKGIVEFKKGLQGIEEEVEEAGKVKPPSSQPLVNMAADRQLTDNTAAKTDYKFDPFTGKPLRVDPVTGKQMRFDPYTGKPLDEEAATSEAGAESQG